MRIQASQLGRMPLKSGALFLVLLSSVLVARGQIQDRPKAGPEQKAMELRVGEWSYEGSLSETPLGPGGKFSGKSRSKMTLDGLFLQSEAEDKGVYGGKEMTYKSLGVMWYDPVSKTYADQSFDNDGMVTKSAVMVKKDTWTTEGTTTDSAGKTYKTRSSTTFSSDGKTSKTKGEFSQDNGKTWMPHWELTAKKDTAAR